MTTTKSTLTAPTKSAVAALQARVKAFAGTGATTVAPMTYHR